MALIPVSNFIDKINASFIRRIVTLQKVPYINVTESLLLLQPGNINGKRPILFISTLNIYIFFRLM